MTRLTAIDPAAASGKAKDLLDAVRARLGITPNMARTMANSPAVLEAYLNFSGALAHGALDAGTREAIALAVAQMNMCHYCLAAHTALGRRVGLNQEHIAASLRAQSPDPKRAAALSFVQKLVVEAGQVSETDLELVRDAGYGEGEIAEIIANVALNVFTNYFNIAAGVEVDFPPVSLDASATA